MKTLIIIVAILSTGLMAGIFFTWTNAVKPGIGTLDDMTYMKAFQAMNRLILNPLFYIVFILPVLTISISTYMSFGSTKLYVFELFLLSTLLYVLGVFLITILGNIPLNELLENTDLEKISLTELSDLRGKIENKWNNFNLIRTVSSFISFLLLVICLFFIKN
ncbi:MAG: DUF1772 domain-containing protein [Flavobacteriales bacterium]|jgi:uncharacterized membrane protein|nr:hypothetical protein [Flavobacteriales bacterium]MDG1917436.1 DUF1772 domain-containing protein [Flavobacteriales bacterium]|tara:strand:- start:3735 stop:4223 length:489 start_codon:yes stop_codon:yes gene_type:complete